MKLTLGLLAVIALLGVTRGANIQEERGLSQDQPTFEKEYTTSSMYYMKTQWGTYAKLDSNGWLTYSSSQQDAEVWKDFGYGKNMYIKSMSGTYQDYYLSADWNKGMGVWSAWNNAAYWEWLSISDPSELKCLSFKSAGNVMALRSSNGYFYAYNGYAKAQITRETYTLTSGMKHEIPRTVQVFEDYLLMGIDAVRPYYLKSQFGYVTLDYKGMLTIVGSKLEAIIWKDSLGGEDDGVVQIKATNGQYTDAIVSTSEDNSMMTVFTDERTAYWKWIEDANGLRLVSLNCESEGNAMSYNEDDGCFYANDALENAVMRKEYYDADQDEPKSLPK